MEIHHLRYFVAVAEELSFRKAAQRLHISQPPLSVHIGQLERELGARLLDRSAGTRTRVTPAGAVFLEEARAILALLERSVERTRRAAQGQGGALSVGLTSSMAYGVVPLLIRDFTRENPEVTLRLLELTTAEQEKALRAHTLDLAFCYPPLEHREFKTLAVCQEQMMLAIPDSHALARTTKVRLKQLQGEVLLSFPRPLSPGLYDLMTTAFSRAGLSPRIAEEATQLQTIIALVCAGLGVAVVPESMAGLAREGVAYRSILDPMPAVQTLLVWRGEPLYSAAQKLIAQAAKRNRPLRYSAASEPDPSGPRCRFAGLPVEVRTTARARSDAASSSASAGK